MANIILRCFCAAFFLVSTLSAFAAGKPLAPGDTFYKDIKGANVSKVSNTGATVGSTGIAKTQKVEIYVQHRTPKPPPPHSNAWNSGTVKTTFAARFGWNAAKVRDAVKFGLKVGKTNAYTIAGTFALGYLLEKTGWFVDDDDTIVYEEIEDYNENDVPDEYKVWVDSGGRKYDSPHSYFMSLKRGLCKRTDKCKIIPHFERTPKEVCVYTPYGSGECGHRVTLAGDCPVYLSPTGVCIPGNKVKRVPVTDSMIDDVDFSDYDPKDKDIPLMSPHLGEPDETVITEQPKPIVLPTETTTTQNSDGSTTTTATDTTVNVTINTTNQGDMYVTTTDTTTTTTYQDGTQTSKTTETKTIDHKDSTPKTENDDTKQDIKVELPEIPTDCDLVPTLCDTQKKIIDQDKNFYDWMREPLDGLNEPELPTTKDKDFTRKYPINISEGQCPKPMELNTILAGTVSVSFEPFCQFASILRYLVLTGASIWAAYILLGVVRRG